MPAKNPRTECCCQPVTFMIAEIVVPPGLRSIANTEDCLDDPAVFDGPGPEETGFGFGGGDDFDLTFDGVRTGARRFAGCPDLRAGFSRMDWNLFVAIWRSLARIAAPRAATGTTPQ
jgi:hypothetical protein